MDKKLNLLKKDIKDIIDFVNNTDISGFDYFKVNHFVVNKYNDKITIVLTCNLYNTYIFIDNKKDIYNLLWCITFDYNCTDCTINDIYHDLYDKKVDRPYKSVQSIIDDLQLLFNSCIYKHYRP